MSTGKAGLRKILCLAFFQAGWFACVLSAAAGKPELGAVSILSWVTVYVFTTHNYRNELLLIGSALVIGYLFDSALALTGILGFSEQALTTIGSPSTYWMLALWINLAAILRTALDWLSGRFVMAALLGGIIGPIRTKVRSLLLPADQHFVLVLRFLLTPFYLIPNKSLIFFER